MIKQILIIATLLIASASHAFDIEIDGIQLTMPENGGSFDDAVLVTDITLPNEETLEWAYFLSSGNNDAVVTVSFEGNPLPLLSDNPLLTDIVDSLLIYIGDYKGQTGELEIVLSSTGSSQSQMLLIQDATELFNVPIPLWAVGLLSILMASLFALRKR